MSSDRARISHDPSRGYQSVVVQQGRVGVEADGNEASAIASEARRLEAIDLIGPAGAPDDGQGGHSGYQVSAGSGGEVLIGAGVFYLGGWRLELPQPVKLSAQPDWLDRPAPPALSGSAAVALLLTEQEVSAVEDQALREVALGGPDTCARTRLMQRFLRLDGAGADCPAAAGSLPGLLGADGAVWDPETAAVLSNARLKVGFDIPAAPASPCDPPVQGGYLGADNQMIRVAVTAYDPVKQTGKLVWSWNNASVLYRADVVASNFKLLKFQAEPVDVEHQPRQGQAVEVLRSSADFGRGDYIAAASGLVMTLGAAYASDERILTLPSDLPADYRNDAPRPLFVRLWETEVAFTSGQPVLLHPSGLTVTLTLAAMPSKIVARPFWCFAVRPSTPVQVYPQRYMEAPQPPEGPRQWLWDLAVISAKPGSVQVVDDCRPIFDPLTKQKHETCCGVVVGPEDVAGGLGLQALIDKLDGPSVVTLKPGSYGLARPLVLRQGRHDQLTIEGCGEGVVIRPAKPAPQEQELANGLVLVDRAQGVTLRRLDFEAPTVEAPAALTALLQRLNGATAPPAGFHAFSSVAITPVEAADLLIEDCGFSHLPPPNQLGYMGISIFLRGDSQGLVVRSSRFVRLATDAGGKPAGPGVQQLGPWRLLLGIAMITQTPKRTAGFRALDSVDARPLIEDADIVDNSFSGFTLAAYVVAQMGLVRCHDNRVRAGAGGFYFISPDLGPTIDLTRAAFAIQAQPDQDASGVSALPSSLLAAMAEMSAAFPPVPAASAGQPPPAAATKPSAANMRAADLETRETASRLAPMMLRPGGTMMAVEAESMSMAIDPSLLAQDPALEAANSALETNLAVLAPMATAAKLAGPRARPALHLFDNDVEVRGMEAPPPPAPGGFTLTAASETLSASAAKKAAVAEAAARTAPPLPAPAAGDAALAGRAAAQKAAGRGPAEVQKQMAADAAITPMSMQAMIQAKDVKLMIDDQPYMLDPNVLAALIAAQTPAQNLDANVYDGLRIVLAHGQGAGSALIHGNRIRTAQPRSHAAQIDWPEEAAVTGNLFVQTGTGEGARCFGLNADEGLSWVSVAGNVVRGRAAIGVSGSHASVAGNTIAKAVITVFKDPATPDKWESVNTIRP